MYNKIFTKILDSSIWLEPDSTRIVWLTCIAAMDEDGFCAFASPANLAHRANVTLTAALAALEVLEGPDANSSNPDHEGRRLERVPGGWMVLNAPVYREMVSREVAKLGNRRRVARHRELKRACNAVVTPSEAETEAETPNPLSGAVVTADALLTERRVDHSDSRVLTDPGVGDRAREFLEQYPSVYAAAKHGAAYRVKEARDFETAIELVSQYPDPKHLTDMLRLFLLKKDWAPKNEPGSPRQFAWMAPQCDALLRESRGRR